MVLKKSGSSFLLENQNTGHPLDLSANGPVSIVSAQGGGAYLGFSTTRANINPDLRLLRDGAGILAQRNSTNAQLFTIEKTFTSATSREYIQSGWNATDSAYDVGVSYQGSAGGSLQAVRIGNRTADGVFSGLTVATNGAMSFKTTGLGVLTGTLNWETYFGQARLATNNYSRFGVMSVGYNANGQSAFMGGIGGWANNLVLGLGYAIQMSSLSLGEPYTLQSSADCQLLRNATGPAWISAANGGLQVRNFANSADAALTCGAITASGQITQTPPASVTLATNGQFSIEMTSNTAGNLVYRGSDGTTRRAALVFV
jgi:hypothetical protein